MTINDETGHPADMACGPQKPMQVMVLQQNRKAESKIAGIYEYGQGRFLLDVISIDAVLPPVIDDASAYLPEDISSDLVLDFLSHPDLSCDLAEICEQKKIPIIASGKKNRNKWVVNPPT
jgi:thymidylate synthase